MENKTERIMKVVNKIRDNNDEDLFGFCISESETYYSYEDIGDYVLYIFAKHPEHAEILNEMLIAVCGYSIESLEDEMEEKRDYFEYL